MDAHQHFLAVADLAPNQRDVGPAIDDAVVGGDVERSVLGRQSRRGDPLHQPVVAHPVLDQVGDRDHQQVVAAREAFQLRDARHRPVLVHDFADDAGRVEAGEAREVDGGLGLTGPDQHAAVARPEGRDMPRLRQIGGLRRGIDGDANRGGAVGRRDARGGHLPGVDGDGERRLETRGVLADDHRDLQLIQPIPGHRQADQAPSVARHEVDGVGCHLLGGNRQIALVLAIFVVDDDDDPAVAECRGRRINRRKRPPAARRGRWAPVPGGLSSRLRAVLLHRE